MKRLLIFIHTEWAFGQIHHALAGELAKHGWEVTLKDWGRQYPHAEFAGWIRDHTHYMTVCEANSVASFVSYGVPREKLAVVAHGEVDIQTLIAAEGVDTFNRFAAYGVVSDSLVCSSLAMGVKRIPRVVRLGVDFAKFVRSPAQRLLTVGHAGKMARYNHFGVEQKRGWLAKAAAEAAGLAFKSVENLPMETMPSFYGSVDAVIMPSLQEGAGLPPLEAAAAGRLVIGTPVGHFPRLAYEGLGVMGPLGAEAFLQFATKRLTFYKRNAEVYQAKCAAILDAAQGRDWPNVVDDWLQLLV